MVSVATHNFWLVMGCEFHIQHKSRHLTRTYSLESHPCPGLPTEIWIMIAAQISIPHPLASLATTCRGLYDICFPLLMHRAAHHHLYNTDTPVLIWASRRGHIRVVKGLLEVGATVNVLDGWDRSSLMHASALGHEDVVECLIVHGADLNLSSHGETALTQAVRFNCLGALNIIFRHGATVDRQYWWTIILAASEGHVEIARLLLEKGVNANFLLTAANEIPLYANRYIGQTATYTAVCNQHPSLVALLMDNGADNEAALEHLTQRWRHLSAAEERCLYELCRRSWWRMMWWKLSRLLLMWWNAAALLAHGVPCCCGYCWALFPLICFALLIVGAIVASTSHRIIGFLIIGFSVAGFWFSSCLKKFLE